MRYFTLIMFIVSIPCFAQSTIPKPPDYSNYTYGDPCNIGDFDGDGSDEVYIKFVNNASGTVFGIYSCKKSEYLLVIKRGTTGNDFPAVPVIGDFNGDGKNDIIVNDKVYTTGFTLLKKKT